MKPDDKLTPSSAEVVRRVLLLTATTLQIQDTLTVGQALRTSIREMKLHWGYLPWCQEKILHHFQTLQQPVSLHTLNHLTGVPARQFASVLRDIALDQHDYLHHPEWKRLQRRYSQ